MDRVFTIKAVRAETGVMRIFPAASVEVDRQRGVLHAYGVPAGVGITYNSPECSSVSLILGKVEHAETSDQAAELYSEVYVENPDGRTTEVVRA